MTTTARIYTDELHWIQKCMKVLNIKSVAEFLKEWHKQVKLGQHRKWYDSLPQAGENKKLKGVCIQKKSATLR